jgi:PKD repeat protein
MKKFSIPLIVVLFGTFNCFPQPSDSGHTEPGSGCQAYFDYYFNDSIKTFVEAYPYRFVDQSQGDTPKWYWDFGDGQTSNEPNPMHFYSHAGDTANVCLTIITADNCKSSYCVKFIVGNSPIPPDCAIDFTISVSKSLPPVYGFNPDNQNDQESYFWDFGDGMYSSEPSPSHIYEFSGNYNVCLQSTNSNGCVAYACKTLQAVGRNRECKAAWKTFGDIFMMPDGTVTSDSSNSPLARSYYFQDMSRGAVVQWHWNFGDGTESKEQNPMHVFDRNGVYDVCLEIVTADSCRSSFCDTLYVGIVPYCSLTGTVVDYTGLDGCGLVIKLDNGEVLEPVEIVPNFVLKNGQRVHLAYTELSDRASICMVGKIVRIDCIGELATDSCLASFNHYPIPWVSSLPPIYQFNDLSTGVVAVRTWDLGDGTVTSEITPTHRYQYSGIYTVCLTIFTKDGCTSTSCETSYYEGANPQPGLCDHFIKLNTEIILNGQVCNGTASAKLVDKEGYEIYAADYLWSTGESTPAIHNLCPGINYSVIITDSTGCAVSGSFSFGGDVILPDSLFGYWNFQQDDKQFVFNIPVYSDSVYCEWDFGDGVKADGSSVNHTYESDQEQMVVLRVYDLNGNLLYNQQIPVTPGSPTRLRDLKKSPLVIYPTPVTDILNIKILSGFSGARQVEILNSNGQVVDVKSDPAMNNSIIQMDVSGLPAGFYIGRLVYNNGLQQPFRFVK